MIPPALGMLLYILGVDGTIKKPEIKKVEVPNINTPGNISWLKSNPRIKTQILNTSLGDIVAQTEKYILRVPKTKYGLLLETIPWEKSQLAKLREGNPHDYNHSYKPRTNLASDVYIVKEPDEYEKKDLARILRIECNQNQRIYFFEQDIGDTVK